MRILNANDDGYTITVSKKEMAMIQRGLSWLHQSWTSESFIVTDFERNEYDAFLELMRAEQEKSS